MDAETQAPRAGRMAVRRFASPAEADRHDREYWRTIPPAERLRQTWRLSLELWRWRSGTRAFVAHDVRFMIGRARDLGDIEDMT